MLSSPGVGKSSDDPEPGSGLLVCFGASLGMGLEWMDGGRESVELSVVRLVLELLGSFVHLVYSSTVSMDLDDSILVTCLLISGTWFGGWMHALA